MNGVLGHICAHLDQTRPGKHPEDGEMNEVTLSSRHRIRNSSPGGLRPSTLSLMEAPYNIQYVRLSREETFFFFET